MAVTEKIHSIDEAIGICSENLLDHRRSAKLMLMLLALASCIIVGGLGSFIYLIYFGLDPRLLAQTSDSILFSNSIIFALLAIFTIVFGVLMSIYRFHLNEISKAEHYTIGFIRIKIAAINDSPGFQSEVRQALTEYAFSFQAGSIGLFKGRNVESPLPGHPTSDAATMILDKLLDKFELVEKKAAK